ncbi:cytochrome b561 and DOMON domain-containing protein At3g25290-like [Neltuma alba]|uniref:cytochrome b561 and DOMON domain-containing protein At3g25290-like n=1 Tax=Neltuma alba TaxID=207710 RepID=UPI0010A5189C|nr:cytochrome b561 and DOMON domain-containing protein At3g25290-like [Prosopis alba]
MPEIPLQSPAAAKTAHLISHRGHPLTQHHQHLLGTVQGILILTGWGTLLPIGVIIARFCRKIPIKCNEWYSSHIACQLLGYILGTIGWSIGIWLGTSSQQYASASQRTLSIVAFTFINVQMLSICMRPKKDQGYCTSWNICHHVVGYVIVVMVIANIFGGINSRRDEAEKLKWAYLGILCVLALIVAALEVFRCFKLKMLSQSVESAANMYSSSPEIK